MTGTVTPPPLHGVSSAKISCQFLSTNDYALHPSSDSRRFLPLYYNFYSTSLPTYLPTYYSSVHYLTWPFHNYHFSHVRWVPTSPINTTFRRLNLRTKFQRQHFTTFLSQNFSYKTTRQDDDQCLRTTSLPPCFVLLNSRDSSPLHTTNKDNTSL